MTGDKALLTRVSDNLNHMIHMFVDTGYLPDANSLMMFVVLSITMTKLKADNIDIYCTNFNDYPLRSEEDEENDRYGQLTSNLPSIYKYNTGQQFNASLQYLFNELEARENGSKSCNRAIWWFIARPELLPTSNAMGNIVIDLKGLLQSGSKYNIHVVLWSSDSRCLSLCYSVNRYSSKEFAWK